MMHAKVQHHAHHFIDSLRLCTKEKEKKNIAGKIKSMCIFIQLFLLLLILKHKAVDPKCMPINV
jgi:hypothetical protein